MGGKSDSQLSPTKTCFDASTAATQPSTALFLTVCVHLSGALRRPGVEAEPQERAPQEN